jgi:aminocarboxymuconate-semialdehyde decarboxylase
MPSTVVDTHVHILHEDLVELAADKVVINGFGAQKPAPRPPGSRRHTNFQLMLDPAFHIEAMDKRGVDIHVLATSTVLQGTSWASPTEDLDYCRLMNDRMGQWIAHAPHRFVGSVVLPLQDMSSSLDELKRCIDTYGFKIVHAPAAVKGTYLGEPYFDAYWDAVNALEALTFIHPEGTVDPWFQNFSFWNSIGQPIEEAKVMASLIYSGLFDRLPQIKVAVSHGGGYLPHYIGRLDRNVSNMPTSSRNISQPPGAYLRRFYYDTCVYDRGTLERLASIVGADRIILGSDFPFGDADPTMIVMDSALSEQDKTSITQDNAASLLRTVGALPTRGIC